MLDQVAALRSAGHDVHLLARETDKVGRGRLYPLTSALTAATGVGPDPGAELDRLQPDIVHLHNTFPPGHRLDESVVVLSGHHRAQLQARMRIIQIDGEIDDGVFHGQFGRSDGPH